MTFSHISNYTMLLFISKREFAVVCEFGLLSFKTKQQFFSWNCEKQTLRNCQCKNSCIFEDNSSFERLYFSAYVLQPSQWTQEWREKTRGGGKQHDVLFITFFDFGSFPRVSFLCDGCVLSPSLEQKWLGKFMEILFLLSIFVMLIWESLQRKYRLKSRENIGILMNEWERGNCREGVALREVN